MKIGAAAIVAVVTLVAVALAGERQANRKPQAMSLRLELFVTDLAKSIDFYTNVLGFERLKSGSTYVPVRSGSVLIGLGPAAALPKRHHFNPEVQNARRGLGAEIVLEVDDVQTFYENVKASGYKRILSPLANSHGD